MPTVGFQVTTDLPPDRVLGVLTDFSDRRILRSDMEKVLARIR